MVIRPRAIRHDPAPPRPPFRTIERPEQAAPGTILALAFEDVSIRAREAAAGRKPSDDMRLALERSEHTLMRADPLGTDAAMDRYFALRMAQPRDHEGGVPITHRRRQEIEAELVRLAGEGE